MANDLVLADSKPAYLKKHEADRQALTEFSKGLGGGMPLPTLSFRGKSFRLRLDGQEVPTKKNELEVIFVAARPNNSKRYYDKSYEGGEVVAPRCSSRDGVKPDQWTEGEQPINPDCATCPMNAWGSATNTNRTSKGKACGDYRRIVVYPVGLASKGMQPQPCVLDLPPTSFKAKQGEQEMGLREYIRLLERNGVDPTQYVVKLGFTDDEYPRLTFTPERYASEEEFLTVTEARASNETSEVLYGEASETPGPIQEKSAPEPEPAPAPKKQAPKKKKEEPAPEPAPEPEPEPEPAEAEAPEEAAEATEAEDSGGEEDSGDDEDLLAQLKKMLSQ